MGACSEARLPRTSSSGCMTVPRTASWPPW
jgi:hypothetical protein